MRSFFVAALSLAGAALAAPVEAENPTAKFQLRALGNGGIYGWSIVNAHIAAGQNAIQIQRPAAFQSDIAYFDGKSLSFELKGTPSEYGVHIPDAAPGDVVQVTSIIGKNIEGFAINGQNLITYKDSAEGFWACPIDGNFNLYYGVKPDLTKLPSLECTPFALSAGFI